MERVKQKHFVSYHVEAFLYKKPFFLFFILLFGDRFRASNALLTYLLFLQLSDLI